MVQSRVSSSSASFCPVEGADYYDQPNHKTIKVIIIISFDDRSIVETDIRIEARAKMNLFKLLHPTAQQNAMQQNTIQQKNTTKQQTQQKPTCVVYL